MRAMTQDQKRVAIVVDDMFFASKINGAAAACGRKIDRIRSKEQLEGLAAQPPSMVIVDLNSDRIDPVEAIRSLKAQQELASIPIVSFVSHVQTELIRQAQSAGCDYVLARSAFTQFLNDIVAGDFSSLGAKT